MELVARPIPVGPNGPTDKVYFAVKFDGGGGAPPVLNSINFSCGVNPGISFNKATVASPFRLGTEINCLLTGHPGTKITSTSPFNPPTVDVYDAIGPFSLIRDPLAPVGSSCFFKLTVVASTSRSPVNREFSYDPDMDIEMSL
jgi:hypothetical protein